MQVNGLSLPLLTLFPDSVTTYVNTFIGSGGEGYGIGSVPPGKIIYRKLY